jgi:hypothetical protein
MASEVEFWRQDPTTKAENIAREVERLSRRAPFGGSLGDRIHSWIGKSRRLEKRQGLRTGKSNTAARSRGCRPDRNDGRPGFAEMTGLDPLYSAIVRGNRGAAYPATVSGSDSNSIPIPRDRTALF